MRTEYEVFKIVTFGRELRVKRTMFLSVCTRESVSRYRCGNNFRKYRRLHSSPSTVSNIYPRACRRVFIDKRSSFEHSLNNKYTSTHTHAYIQPLFHLSFFGTPPTWVVLSTSVELQHTRKTIVVFLRFSKKKKKYDLGISVANHPAPPSCKHTSRVLLYRSPPSKRRTTAARYYQNA